MLKSLEHLVDCSKWIRLSGTQIIDVLEQAVENVFTADSKVKVGGMIQVGGIRFRFDPKMAKGHRIWHVERTEGRWKPMDEYTVGTNTMMVGGGHNYQTLTRGAKLAEHGSQYEMIRRWIARKDTVATPPSGRIERAAKIT